MDAANDSTYVQVYRHGARPLGLGELAEIRDVPTSFADGLQPETAAIRWLVRTRLRKMACRKDHCFILQSQVLVLRHII